MARDKGYFEAQRRIKQAKRREIDYLDLSNLALTTIPHNITTIPNLHELNLSNNNLTFLPDTFLELTSLKKLDLRRNHLNIDGQLSLMPWAISKLTNLQELNLIGNQLSRLPEEIGNLTSLKVLYLTQNNLEELPEKFFLLTNLRELYLSRNRLKNLPRAISKLVNLQKLYLSNNQLKSLPDTIKNLINLEILVLSENLLNRLPREICLLTNLQRLHIHLNQLNSLPKEIDQLINLKCFVLASNPLPILPEIIRKGWGKDYWDDGDPQSVITYYLEQEMQPLNEAKVILVGQGTVGKTSIVKCLLGECFSSDENKTDGISIRNLEVFQINKNNRSIRLNIWDFGGQEIMHATHQFFLTKRSLYLLVLNNRQTEDENRLEYWLNTIESFGGDSPIIIVGNKNDEHPLDIDQRGLQRKYPQIKDFIATSCKTGLGIEELQQFINREIGNLKHVGDLLPQKWFEVKTHLEGLKKNYIPYEEYQQICEENQILETKKQKVLVSLLHDLGIVLNFYDDPQVSDTHVINPEWVTTGIYKIINHDPLIDRYQGILSFALLSEILPHYLYPPQKHSFIISIMKKFELCFAIDNQTFLLPNLLPKTAPEHLDRTQWQEALRFEYHYSILAQSVISRFIVKMHHRVFEQTYWRTGVVLFCNDNQALVEADLYDKKIFIAINGQVNTRRDFLAEIRGYFNNIHNSFSKLPEERVPIPQDPKGIATVSYDHLLFLESISQDEYFPEGMRECVSVRKLLNGVRPETQNFRQSDKINIAIHSSPSMSNIYQKSESGDNVAGDKIYGDKVGRDKVTNYNNSQNLAQAAHDINALISQLSTDYNSNTPLGQMQMGSKIVETIDSNLPLKTRTINALKEAGSAAFEEAIDHPVAKVVVAALKGFIDAD